MNFDVPITIALSKGRIYEQSIPLLEQAGIVPADDPETSRKLILDTNHEQIKLVIIRATDVPTYVQWGAADIGVAGKDVLVEHGGEGIYEPLDLNIARCRMMVAGKPDSSLAGDRLRIATKYVNAAKRHFAAKGQQVEIIKLYGSMELAPIVGLSDLIVDLVESGSTLKANGLVPLEHIADISSRLVVNRASWKTKHDTIKKLMDILESAVAGAS
ncbi:MAG: ATP phosphoribosyltransferase [Chromatiales bacterium]|jgi:ATP phosphoribosyltransferase